ncbi:MAG TPA: phage terminase large subunit [Firmicutes bacterium]|nr:phage terminase large subunit [Bacillota bacterium]
MSILQDFKHSKSQSFRRQIIENGKKDFRSYCNAMNPNFFMPHRIYQDKICHAMQAIFEKKLRNENGQPYTILIINLPPGFGKSYTAVLFATWAFGQSIKNQVITVSYNQTLSTRFAKSVRDAIEDKEIIGNDDYYVVGSFFPDVRIKQGDGAMNLWTLEGAYMSYLATSFDGAITGMRGNIGIIDDPIKNAEEAVNERVKEKHWDFYKNTFSSRMLDGAIQVIIQTRWATDDLAGKLLQEFPDRCYVLKMPALVDGKSLCEDLYSTVDLLNKKETLDEHIWLSNYMQEPIDLRGALYGEFKTYYAIDTEKFERVIAYVDTADTGADRLMLVIAGVIDNLAYTMDIYYTDEAMEITEKETARRMNEYNVRECIIESNNGGRGFARNVERILKESFKNKKCMITWFHQSKNKKTRILVNATNVMEQIIMPDDWKKRFKAFYTDIVKYQRKGKNEHDDAPDGLTGLVEFVNGDVKGIRRARVLKRSLFGL